MGNKSKSLYRTENFGSVRVVNSSGKVVISENRLKSVSCAVANSVLLTGQTPTHGTSTTGTVRILTPSLVVNILVCYKTDYNISQRKISGPRSKVSQREGRIQGLKEGDVMYSIEDGRNGFTGYAVFREHYSVCLENHKLQDEEEWEVRLKRSVEVIVRRMLNAECEELLLHQQQLFSRQP